MPLEWDIVTPHYPPQTGGIADYTLLLARALHAVGDTVAVWCPIVAAGVPEPDGVRVFQVLERFTLNDVLALDRMWAAERARSRRILVMYHPHGFGWRSMNIPFCLWLWKRAAVNGDRIVVLLHERGIPFRQGPWKHDIVAGAHRIMLALTLQAAARVWTPVKAWVKTTRPWALGRRVSIAWLPVFSNIQPIENADQVVNTRNRFVGAGEVLVGHFGVCPLPITRQLDLVLPTLLRSQTKLKVLLVGIGTDHYANALRAAHPDVAGRIQGLGAVSPAEVSLCLQACDVLLQPYAEGVNARRTTAMAALANGVPMVTTHGRISEPLWRKLASVRTAPAGNAPAMIRAVEALLADLTGRESMSAAGRAYFEENFTLQHTVQQLRSCEISIAQGAGELPFTKPTHGLWHGVRNLFGWLV